MNPQTRLNLQRAEHAEKWTPQISIMSDSDHGYRKHKQNDLLKPNIPIDPHTRLIVDRHGCLIRRDSKMPPVAKRLVYAEVGTLDDGQSWIDGGHI